MLRGLRFFERLFYSIGSRFEGWADGMDKDFHNELRSALAEPGDVYNYQDVESQPTATLVEKQRKQDLRTENERDQERALQDYLTEMKELILEKDLNDPKVQSFLRSLTLNVLRRLTVPDDLMMLYLSDYGIGGREHSTGDTRKGTVVRFLYENGLIIVEEPIVALKGANLRYASLWEATLDRANLQETNLIEAKLIRASLQDANLIKANLREADLHQANLSRAKLNEAILFGVKLHDTDLGGADLSGARLGNLEGAKYTKDTIWPAEFDPEQAGAKLVE